MTILFLLACTTATAATLETPAARLTPTITENGAPAALTTTYGTASSNATFSISGTNMLQGILVTPPGGFEVSTDNITFSPSVTVGSAGNIPPATVYIRLSAPTAAGSYSGNIVLSSTGATDVNVFMPNSTVNPAQLTISPDNVTKTYGTILTTVNGSAAFTDAGLVNGETIGSVTISYSSGSAATDGVGTYSYVVSASSPTGGTFDPANYNINYTYGQITVNPAPLTVTANDVTKTYGQTLTSYTGSTAFTVTGLLNGETIGSVSITYGTGGQANYPMEPCDACVGISSAAGGTFNPNNYAITYVNGNINVNPAPLTVTADNVTKTYGETLTSYTGSAAFTASGLQNGETIGSVSITYGTSGQANYPVQSCDGCVGISGAAGGTFNPNDYVITYVSGNINVNPAPLTITADNVTKTYGETLTSNTGSTAFTASGLQNGETIGSVSITYGTSGQANYPVQSCDGCVGISNAAGGTFNPNNYVITYVNGNINAKPAPLTITADNVTKTYGQTLTSYTGSTAFTATGLVNGETIGSVSINYGTGGQANYPPESCGGCVGISNAAGGTFNPNDYVITYVNGNINVNPAPLTITADDVTKTYGETLTSYSGSTAFTATGLLNGETIGSVSITYGTGGQANYPLEPCDACVGISNATGGTFNPNDYVITYVNGNISVNPAPLTITADNQIKLYGEPNPVLTVSYNGFVNGEGPAQLTTPPDVTTTATVVSPPGKYPIVAMGAADPDYTITYVPGLLEITASFNIPNAFTPNGDGINDTWHIQFLDNYQNCTVKIFSRMGQNIYYSSGYGVPWDGTYKGSALPAGTYYYIIELKDINKILSGYVVLIR